MFNPEKWPTEPSVEVEKAKTFETWQNLVTGEKKEPDTKVENLENEQFKELLHKEVEDKLDETTKVLDVKLDEAFVERMNKEENSKEKARMQKEIVKSVVEQLNSIPHDKWAFTPQEIEKRKKMNCSGAALLCGHILNKAGIKTEYGYPAGHAMNFVELADGSIEYVDARTNVIEDIKTEEEEVSGVKIRKLDHKGIDYKLIPSVSQEDAMGAMMSNIEALKGEAKKEDGDPAAKEIYENNKDLLEAVNYQKISDDLYPELAKFFKTKEWKDEENRIRGPEAFNKYLNKVRERFLNFSPDIQEKLKPELKNQKELIRDFLLDKEVDIESKASKDLLDFMNQAKKELTPLKKRNIEDYNKFVENLVKKF